MAKKKQKAQLQIFDKFGEVLQSVYVDDPTNGLRASDLSALQGQDAQLQGLDLTEASLYAARLRDADLSFAILRDADLRGASLDRAVCKNTNFRGANLGRDNLNARTSLLGTDLSTADLHGAVLVDAVYDDATRFPENFDPSGQGLTHVDDLTPGDLHRR
jgi:uncharacterized protein YjbI with pentapeptide repeats